MVRAWPRFRTGYCHHQYYTRSLGQARNFYQYAASLVNQSGNMPGNIATEDSLAYRRTEREFKNILLCELPKGDWAQTVLRQFFYSVFCKGLYTQLLQGQDAQLSAIAEKSLKEVLYHVRWSGEWVMRLGDGTAESNQRMKQALQFLWPYTGEMFMPAGFENNEIDLASIKTMAITGTLHIRRSYIATARREYIYAKWWQKGIHTEHMGFLLAEMQYLQRMYPDANW